MKNNLLELRKGDCLELMKDIEDKSIDMILCDLPYGTTACKWDTIIPFDKLWKQYQRIIKDNGAIVLTASQPFTSNLIMSNMKMFRYNCIWEKTVASNFMLSKKQPLKLYEDVVVFYKKQPIYNPQMREGKPYIDNRRHLTGKQKRTVAMHDTITIKSPIINTGTRYPSMIIKINNESNKKTLHPTQKPLALFEYLIKTYTNEDDLVLDNCAGSGTSGVACQNLNRNCIMIEKEEEYCNIIKQRLSIE